MPLADCFKSFRPADRDNILKRAEKHKGKGLSEKEAVALSVKEYGDDIINQLDDIFKQLGVTQNVTESPVQETKPQRKSGAKFDKARKSAAELLDLIGPGLKIDEQFDPQRNQKIILKAGEVVADYIDAGVTRFAEMVQDIIETMGEKAARVLFDPMKKGYGSQMASVSDDVAEKMDDLKVVRAAKIEDFIKEEEPQSERLPKSTFVSHIKNLFGTEKLDKRKIEAIGEQHGITDKNEVKELVELAIVSKARELAQEDDFKGLVELYDNQPTLSHRTNESISKQQYSTPAPIAYLMGKYLNLDKVKSALEPSAGNGMLTIVADPKVFTVNEIDPVRLANLKKQGFGEVLEQDGRESFDRDKHYNAVITNPPFGGTNEVKIDGYKFNELAQIMSVNALDAMKDNGKAAIIIGGNNKFDEKGRLTGRDLIYFNYLFNKYNVEDVIDVDGDIYRKQGASFPIRIILINGRKTATNSDVAPEKAWFKKQENSFEGIKDRIDKFQGYENIQPSELVGGPTKANVGGSTREGTKVKSGGIENVPGGKVSKPSEQLANDQPGTVRGGSTTSDATGTQPGVDSGSNSGESTVPEDTGRKGPPKSTKLNESEGTKRTTEKQPAKREREATARSDSGESTVAYKPISGSGSLNVSTPAALQQQMSDALTDLVNEVGDIDKYVIDKLGYKDKNELYKALAAEQVDGVALAIRNVERGTGIIIGDQPGIGKGRQAAAMVRYALEQGLTPIFFTKNPSLFSDIYRDLNDVGLGNIKPFILNARDANKFPAIYDRHGNVLFTPAASTSNEHRNAIRDGKLPDGTKIILASYSQFANQTGEPTREKTDFIERKSKGTLLIMDESHLASGEESNTSEVFMRTVQNAKGVVFLSGTYAKRAGNMPLYALKTSMREAQVESVDALLEAINNGGAPLQEILAGILTESGEMIRRERTFKGIEVKTHVMGGDDPVVKSKQREQADIVTGIMRDIVEFQKAYIFPHIKGMDNEIKGGRIGGRRGADLGGVKGSPYFQKVFNVVNQLLYAIKAEETANLIIAEHKAGRKPFLAIRSTMESMLKDMLQRGEMNVGDPFKNDFSFVLKKGLEGTTRITVQDAQGNKTHTTIPISDLSPAAQAHYKYLMQKIKALKTGLSLSPIDIIVEKLEAAGLRVGEVTGRQYKIVTENGIQYLKPNKKLNQTKSYQKYNNGELDVLIVNRSGSTGVSAHSSKDVKDQTPRTMFILEAELDISELVQMLFRVNRSGQVNLPKYVFVSSTIPAEQRLINMSTSKLKSLDAQTTSNQKQSSGLMSSVDIFNKYGDQVVLEYLRDNPDIDAEIGSPISSSLNEAGEEVAEKDAAHKATGKIAILSTDKQEHFYNEVTERYQKQLQFLNEAGINDLVIETLPLQAKTLKKETIVIGKGGRSKFGEDSYLEEVEVNTLKKPMTKAEIDHHIKQLSHSKETLLSKLEDYRQARIGKINKDLDDKYKPLYEKVESDQTTTEKEKEEARTDLKEKEDFVRNGKVTAEESKISFVKSLINFYKPGEAVAFPVDLVDMKNSGSRPAIFLGFDVNLDSEKAFLPSNISLKFAINDSRRSIGIAASKDAILNNIRNSTHSLSDQYKKGNYEGWDQLKKPKDRVKRYIATGNILQALSNPMVNKGKIIKYDTEDGYTVTGIMQPEDFNPSAGDGKIKVPAHKAETLIRNSQGDKFISGSDVAIKKLANGRFEIRVPLSKQTGGKYYQDEDLNKLVVNGRWDSVANTMQAFIEGNKLEELLALLSDKFGTTFEVDVKNLGDLTEESDSAAVRGANTITSPDQGKQKKTPPAPSTPGKVVKPFNMADRVKEIFKSFGIPINEKSLRASQDGVFKHFTDAVRVQALWDIYVAAHEGLHAFDKKYNIWQNVKSYGSKKLKNELFDAYKNLYPVPKKNASTEERIKEGMAMVTQYYLADPVLTEQRFPEAIKHILKDGGQFYHEEVGQFLSKMQELSDDYFTLKPQDKINARIKWAASDSRNGLGFWAKTRTQLANDLVPAEIVDNMLGGVYRANAIIPNVTMLRNIGSIVSNWVKHPFGVTSKPQTYLGNGEWGPTKSGYRVHDYMKKLNNPNNLIEFNNYLVARRQYEDYKKLEDLDDQIANLPPTQGGQLATLTAQRDKLNSILENNKIPFDIAEGTVIALDSKYKEETKIYDAINHDMIDFMEATELLSMDKADEYRQEKGYAAFQRHIEDEHLATVDGMNLSATSKSSVKALKQRTGSALQLIPPTYSQMLAINEVLTKGQRNLVWKGWADAAKANKEIAQIFEKVTALDVDPNSKDIQVVSEKGVKKYYKIGEEVRIFGEALTPTQIEFVSEVMRGFARVFQTGTTTAYPIFGLINITMDSWVRLAQTKTGLIPIISDAPTVGKAFKGLIDWMFKLNSDNDFTDFMALGGRRSTYQAQQLVDADASLGQMLNKDWWSKTKKVGEIGLQMAELPTNFTELIGRGTEYVRAIEKGYPTNVAMMMAANVSVNFSNKGKFGGKVGQEMVKWVSYMGASIQALDQFIKTAKSDPKRVGSVIAFATAITSIGALLTYMLGDDDEKDMLADQLPEDYARWIYLPNSVFGGPPGLVRFRMPEQIGTLGGMTQLYFSHLYKQKPLLFKEFYQVGEAALPSQVKLSQGPSVLLSYIPTAISPEIQVVTNTRFYPEVLPIVPKNLKDYAEWRQYTKYTSRAAKAIGEMTAGNLNISPVKADFYVRAKLGRAFQLVQSLTESAIFGDDVRSYIPMWQEYDRIIATGRMYNRFWDIVEEARANTEALDPRNTPGASIPLYVQAKIRSELLNVDAKMLRLAMDKINNGGHLEEEEKRSLYNMILRAVKDDEQRIESEEPDEEK